MKQSYGTLLAARLMSPAAAMGLAAAAAVGVAACHNNSSTPCPNLSQASVVIGQPDFVTTNTNVLNASTLASPESTAIDPITGALYVADTLNNRVLIYKQVPATNGVAADFVLGQPCFTYASATSNDKSNPAGANLQIPEACGSGGSLNAYTLNRPSKVWISANEQLVITDTGNSRVLIFNTAPSLTSGVTPNTVLPTVIVGQTSIGAYSPNQNVPISASTLSTPSAAVIAGTALVVADKGNNRVLIWNTVPSPTSTSIAPNTPADDELGQQAVSTNGTAFCKVNTDPCFTTATTNPGDTYYGQVFQALMNSPTDVLFDGTSLYVSDSNHNRVFYYPSLPNATSSGVNQQPQGFIGQANFDLVASGSGTQGLFNPTGLSIAGGALFIADSGNNRVLQYNAPTPSSFQANLPATYVFGQQDFSHVTENDPDQNGQVGDQRNNPATIGPVNGTLWGAAGALNNNSTNWPGILNGLPLLFVSDTLNDRVLIYDESNGVNGTDTNLCS